MGSLFLVELGSFLAKTTQSTIVVDFNRDQQVQSLFMYTICCVCVSELKWSVLNCFVRPPNQPSTHINKPNQQPLKPQIRINFNITMLDVPCEYATVDVLDILGARGGGAFFPMYTYLLYDD